MFLQGVRQDVCSNECLNASGYVIVRVSCPLLQEILTHIMYYLSTYFDEKDYSKYSSNHVERENPARLNMYYVGSRLVVDCATTGIFRKNSTNLQMNAKNVCRLNVR